MRNVKKKHGYFLLPKRISKILLQELGADLFGFCVGLALLAVWDRSNPNFMWVTKNQTVISEALNMSQSAVSRRLSELENHHKDFVLRERGKGIKLYYLPLFLFEVVTKIYSNDYADLHEIFADLNKVNAELHNDFAKLQDSLPQKHPQSIYVSSNDIRSSVPSNTNSNDGSSLDDVDEIDKGIEEMIRAREENNAG